jgi:hypothetical protein
MQPTFEQLPDRCLPSALFAEVNDAWRSVLMGPLWQPSLVEDAALDRIADAWARDANGLGGDGRDVGPQNELIGGWWMGAEIETSVPALVRGSSLVHGSGGVRGGLGQSGIFLCLITGLPAAEAGTVPPSNKGPLL